MQQEGPLTAFTHWSTVKLNSMSLSCFIIEAPIHTSIAARDCWYELDHRLLLLPAAAKIADSMNHET
jgi:hypothetical protein